MITDRELARYISNNLHLYLADEDKPVECKVVDVSKNNGGTVAGVQILMHGVDHGPVISMETIRVYTYDRNSKSIHQVDESMYDKNCEQPEFKQSKSGMAQNNGLVYKEKQVDIEI